MKSFRQQHHTCLPNVACDEVPLKLSHRGQTPGQTKRQMQVASRVHTAVTTTQRAMLRVMRGVAAAAVLGVKVKEVCFLCI